MTSMWPFTSKNDTPATHASAFRSPAPAATTLPVLATRNRETKAYSEYALYRGAAGESYLFPNMPPAEIIRHYSETAPLATAINRIATAVGSLPLAIKNHDTGETTRIHPLLSLLNNPNREEHKTRQPFMRDATIWKILEGDTYITAAGPKNRPPHHLYILNPLYLTIDPSPNGYAQTYRYAPDTRSPTNYVRDPRTDRFYDATGMQELLHIANFNANRHSTKLDGESEVLPLYYEINQYQHGSMHNLSLLQNGARPGGAFVLKAENGQPAILTEAQYNRLKMQIYGYTGPENAGRPLLLEGGLEWQQMEMTPQDMDFKSLREQAEETIYSTLGLPVQLVKATKATANNMVNIRLEFYENRVLPLADELCDHLTYLLRYRYPTLSEHTSLIVDRDNVDVLTKQRLERRKGIEDSTTMTINEKRKEFKLPDIEGGDKIVDPNGRPIAGPDAESVVEATPAPKPTTAPTPKPTTTPTPTPSTDK